MISLKFITASQAYIVSKYKNTTRKLMASLYIFLRVWHLPEDG
jgi:hypothetical protein